VTPICPVCRRSKLPAEAICADCTAEYSRQSFARDPDTFARDPDTFARDPDTRREVADAMLWGARRALEFADAMNDGGRIKAAVRPYPLGDPGPSRFARRRRR
jgi:hypothetical protein